MKYFKIASSLLSVRGAVLVFVLGAIIFAGAAVMIFGTHLFPLQRMTAFETGQYYFNQSDQGDAYDLKKARAAYERVVSGEDAAATQLQANIALYQLGRIDFLEGALDDAITTFGRVVEQTEGGMPSAYYMLGLTYAYRAKMEHDSRDWKYAEDAFLAFVEAMPENPWGRVDLSWIYFAQGKYADMIPLLEDGLGYEPDNPWLHNMYGLALQNNNDPKGAYEHFSLASTFAQELTVDDWAFAYPGNNPMWWDEGLTSFQSVIEKNKVAAEARLKEADRE